jgi:hypothetical protein
MGNSRESWLEGSLLWVFTLHFHVLDVLMKQNRACQHWWNFLQYLQASWWPSTFIWSRMAIIWESNKSALLSNVQVGIRPSSHLLPILNVACIIDWNLEMLERLRMNPKFMKTSGTYHSSTGVPITKSDQQGSHTLWEASLSYRVFLFILQHPHIIHNKTS